MGEFLVTTKLKKKKQKLLDVAQIGKIFYFILFYTNVILSDVIRVITEL